MVWKIQVMLQNATTVVVSYREKTSVPNIIFLFTESLNILISKGAKGIEPDMRDPVIYIRNFLSWERSKDIDSTIPLAVALAVLIFA